MNIKYQFKRSVKALSLTVVMLFAVFSAKAQCYITYANPPCVGQPINFFCNVIGASNYNWDFNGEGANLTLCNPVFVFNSPGLKKIKLSLVMANGQPCSATIDVTVKAAPTINIRQLTNDTSCFFGNSFCFVDSTKPVPNPNGTSCIKSVKYLFSDGELIKNDGTTMPFTFCKSFTNPAGGTYDMLVETEDCNGCISRKNFPGICVVRASLGLSFSTLRPKACDSVTISPANSSTIAIKDVDSFRWDWGDGTYTIGKTKDTGLWKKPSHTFHATGPNSGDFNTRLTVWSKFGCKESFTFFSSATNIVLKPRILATRDSVCIDNPEISFSIAGGSIPKAVSPLFNYGDPPTGPLNTTRQWAGTHKFSGLGPYKIKFTYSHPICGNKEIYDTIMVIGPQSVIEKPFNWLVDSLRYQCVIKDTVKFKNFSQFYHNDFDFTDDDSVWLVYDSVKYDFKKDTLVNPSEPFDKNYMKWLKPGFNTPLVHIFKKTGTGQTSEDASPQNNRGNSCVFRLWDFDDDFCEKCTTDTKHGINSILKNCKYSKDSLPQHWYTPWDSIYQTKNSMIAANGIRYNKDSGQCYQVKIWPDDSMAIIRDTFLYYGDNPLAQSAKDSVIFKNIKNKVKVPAYIVGPARFDAVSYAPRFYLRKSDTIYIDNNNGFPPNLVKGTRYQTIQLGQTMILNSNTDTARFSYWIVYIQDTIANNLVQPWHKVLRRELMQGYKSTDSLNAPLHRQKFYEGTTVRCFNVRLFHKDLCHKLQCEHQATSSLALMPPSAKKLRKEGIQCLGGSQDNYGITFILSDTKPGCTRTYAQINFDTAVSKTQWVNAIGPNLSGGSIATGNLPPANPPYLGYALMGPAPSRFSKQFTTDDFKDSITGYINVGLLVGNGMWLNPNAPPDDGLNYPATCIDTIYYPKFARFPVLDNKFRIVKPQEGTTGYTKICRKDTICLTLMPKNRSYIPDVEELNWSLSAANVGKYYDQYYTLQVNEAYQRFQKNKDKPSDTLLYDYLYHKKFSYFDGKYTTLDSQYIKVAEILKWHTEADITPVFDVIKQVLAGNNIDIYELTPAQLSEIIWNGVGTFGKPYTGSRGCLDTTGYGAFIRFYKVADQKNTLHYRDTSILPIDNYYAHTDTSQMANSYADTCSCNILKQFFTYWVQDGGLSGTGQTFKSYLTSRTGASPDDPTTMLNNCTSMAETGLGQDKNGNQIKWVWGRTFWTKISESNLKVSASQQGWDMPRIFKCMDYIAQQNVYCFVPQYSGYYIANFGLRSRAPENCVMQTGTAKKVIVGFYGRMDYTDTILCHGSDVSAYTEFKYFELFPEITNRLLDPTDYWYDRRSEAGQINREGKTKWDLSKADDDTAFKSRSIFGPFPYGQTGVGIGSYTPVASPPGVVAHLMKLGGISIPGAIYYLSDTGGYYNVRVTTADSMGCRDTFPQDIFVTSVKAKFSLDQTRPQCKTIIELFDSSKVYDPCKWKLKKNNVEGNCDYIVKWTINWGDSSRSSKSVFTNSLPPNVGHDFTRNGHFMVILKVETHLGCVDSDTMDVYIPGPIPMFDTFIPRKYCVNERVDFTNLSKYVREDSSDWIWHFGYKNIQDNQKDTIIKGQNDTINFRYPEPGRYYIFLQQYFVLKMGSLTKKCSVIWPDTADGQMKPFYIDVFPYDTVTMKPRDTSVCLNAPVTVEGRVTPAGKYTSYVWNLGMSPTDTLVTPDSSRTVSFSTPGTYKVKFKGDKNSVVTTTKVCPAEDSVTIRVADVKADFDIDTSASPVYCFENKSTNSTDHRWSLYNQKDIKTVQPGSDRKLEFQITGSDANVPKPCRDYRDSLGAFWVCLEATNQTGCKDTICKLLINRFEASIRPPNVFTPDNGTFQGTDREGLKGNDVFNIEIKGEEKYELYIYDRWGVLVFESKDKNIDWNGKVKNTGALCPDGNYFYILKYRYKGLDKDEPVLNGTVQIIR